MKNTFPKNSKILITGGTGSFGTTVLNNFLNDDVSEIRIFSRDEKKQFDLRENINNDKAQFYLGDVRDYKSVFDALHDIDYVFHAAALKQVPNCEFYPSEAIRTNILGAENVMRAAIERGVKKCIFLSTDKAVYPINAMGMTKALMEKLMLAKSRITNANDTIFCATRYGNVMGSRGSVIPTFTDQINNNKDITITDPSMTRFMMTLQESVELVLYAFKHANPGDIFVQKASACTIELLAKTLMKIYDKHSNIKILGTRHGEKLFETLVSREEMFKAEDLGDFYKIPFDNRDLNYKKYFHDGEKKISETSDFTSHNTYQLSEKELTDLLNKANLINKAH